MVKPGAAVLDVGVSPRRRQDRRRRGRRRLGRRRLGLAEPRRRRADDARDAAVQHRRASPSRRWPDRDRVDRALEPPERRPRRLRGAPRRRATSQEAVRRGRAAALPLARSAARSTCWCSASPASGSARRARRLAHRHPLDRRRAALRLPCVPARAAQPGRRDARRPVEAARRAAAAAAPARPCSVLAATIPGPVGCCAGLDQAELLDGVALLGELGGGGVDRAAGEVVDLEALDDLQSPPVVVTGKEEIRPSGTP